MNKKHPDFTLSNLMWPVIVFDVVETITYFIVMMLVMKHAVKRTNMYLYFNIILNKTRCLVAF